MPIKFSFILVLLFLSSHACNARILVAAHDDLAKEDYDQKLKPGDVNASAEAKRDHKFGEKNDNGEYNELGRKEFHRDENRANKEYSSSRKSWRVPHKKRGEQEPGFNLDYLPPKTHPPVHN